MLVQEGYASILGKQRKLLIASGRKGPDHSVWTTLVVLGGHQGLLYSNGKEGFEVNEKGHKLFREGIGSNTKVIRH